MNYEIRLVMHDIKEILEHIAFKIYTKEYEYSKDVDRITISKDGSCFLIFDKKAGDTDSIARLYNSEKIIGTIVSAYDRNIFKELHEEISRLVNSYRREEILKNIQKILP